MEHCWNVFVYIALVTKFLTNNKHEKTVKLANAIILREAVLMLIQYLHLQ